MAEAINLRGVDVEEARRRATARFQHSPILQVRDRLFHALFYRVTLIYARSIPRPLQRILEFVMLFEVNYMTIVSLTLWLWRFLLFSTGQGVNLYTYLARIFFS